MTVDRDDAVAILLDYALRDLDVACRGLTKPELGWWEFVALVVTVLKVHPHRWDDVEQVCLSAARRVTAEIRASL